MSADLNAPANSTGAASGSGSGILAPVKQFLPSELVSSAVSVTMSAILGAVGTGKSASPTSSEKFGLAASFLYLDQQNNAVASIGPQADVSAAGKVDVSAHIKDVLTYKASASVDQSKLGDGSDASSKAKERALAAAVAVVDLENHTQASIGDGAVVDAGNAIIVSAHSDVPVPYEAWGDWSTVTDFKSGLEKLEALLGSATYSTITGWTQSFAESDKLGLAGSFNVFTLDNQADAWIGNGARINTRLAGAQNSLAPRDVTVSALATQGIISLGGVFGFKLAGVDSQNTGIGGALVLLDFSDGAHASVGRRAIVQGNDVLIEARSESDNITIAEAGGKSAKGTAFNASIALVGVTNSTTALVDGSAVISAAGKLDVRATDETRTITAAGGFSKGENAIGLAVAVNEVERDTRAGVFATSSLPPVTLSLAGAQIGADGKITLAPGAVAVAGQAVIFDAGTGSSIGGLADDAVHYVIVPDADHPNVIQLAAAPADALNRVAVTGLGSAQGPALALSSTGALGSGLGLSVRSQSEGVLDAVSVAGSFAQDGKEPAPVAGESASARMDKLAAFGAKAQGRHGIAFSGDASVNDVADVTQASLAGVRMVRAPSLDVTASNSTDVLAVAGAVAISTAKGKVPGIAGSYSQNDMANVTQAFVRNSTVEAGGAVNISASTAGDIQAWTVGVAVSTRHSGVVGSVSINSVGNDTSAFIDGQSGVRSGGTSLSAVDGASIFALAGSLDYAGDKGAGFGASVAINEIGNTTDAHVAQSDVEATTGGVSVSQQADQDIRAVAISAGASTGGLAANFAVSVNTIESTDTAHVTGKRADGIQSKTGVAVSAEDSSSILAIGGGLAVSTKSGGVGGSGAFSLIENNVSAYLSDTQVKSSTGSVTVAAKADDAITTIGIGFGGGKAVGIAGSVAVNKINTTTEAYLNHATVTAGDSVAVTADAEFDLATYGGALGVGFSTAGIGGTVAVNLLGGDTRAYITGGSAVDAAGNDTVALITQDANGNGSRQAQGVAVVARTHHNAETWAISGGFSNGFGLGLTGSGNQANGETIAYISGNSAINKNGAITANAAQDVSVEAFTSTNFESYLGGIGIGMGSAGVGVTVGVGLIDTTTRAYVDSAQIRAKDDVSVGTYSSEAAKSVGIAAAAGGSGALAGTVFVTKIDGTSEAYIRNTDTADAGGDLTVRAEDHVYLGRNGSAGVLAGAGAVSGGAAAGAAVSAVTVTNTTRAYIADAQTDALGATRVQAVATQEANSGVMGITLSQWFGAGASVVVNNFATTTEAYISETSGTTKINADTALVTSAQNVEVSASNTTTLDTQILAVSGAFVGIGASVDVTTLRNDVRASIGAGAEVNAKGNVDVSASSTREIDSMVVAFGGGVVGVQGAVALVSVGAAMTAEEAANTKDTVDGQAQIAHEQMKLPGTAQEYSVGAMFDATAIPGGTRASTGDGAKVSAGGNISVHALDKIEVDLTQGAGVAGAAGFGASVGIATLKPYVQAYAGENATLSAGGTIGISAEAAIVNSNVGAYIAGIGGVALVQSVAIIDSEATVEAYLGKSAKVSDADSVTVSATRTNNQEANAYGVSVGGSGAFGGSAAKSSTGGNTTALVDDGADLAKAGALNVIANNTYAGNFANSAKAVAGAGGGLLGASGALATAESSGNVVAATGEGIKLPMGSVIIAAGRESLQKSEGLGVTVGGTLAIGVTITRSESSGQTSAELGGDAITGKTREGDLLVTALATDSNEAKSVAGSGGAVAGNGAEASTEDNSQVYAGIGADTGTTNTLYSGAVTVQALHKSHYGGEANSVNAALVGASGAFVHNDIASGAQVRIGNDVHIAATRGIRSVARNEFASSLASDSASGAAGGVLVGSAAVSRTDIHGDAEVLVGTGVGLRSGTDPVQQPGGILIEASTGVAAADQVKLTTGGLIAGAGTESSIDVITRNNVMIGGQSTFDSLGNIGIGTYTQASASATSLVNTWGLAGVGIAHATANVTASENVSIGAGAVITGFGNVNVTAGDDPLGISGGVLSASANAQGYVRGLIAIPVSYANTTVTGNSLLDIDADAKIRSAQNVTIGAYNGAVSSNANGEAHGYQLGFIPTNIGNSGDGARTHTSAQVVQDGEVVAGFYHTLNITIPDCPVGAADCAVNAAPGGAPFTSEYDKQFNTPAFIAQHFSGPGAALIASGTSSSPVGAVTLGTLFAAGGTVTVNANALSGSGSIAAYGGPSITVDNQSSNYLVMGNVLIPNTPGGRVQFTGAAGRNTPWGGSIQEVRKDVPGSISIHNSHAGPVGNSNYGPALFLTGDIANIAGSVNVVNDYGSLGQAATIFGKDVTVKAPEGVAVIELPDPKAYYAGGNPYSEWNNSVFWPGGNPATAGTPNANTAFTDMYGTGVWTQAPRNYTDRYYFSYADCSGGDCYMNVIQPTASRATAFSSYASADLSGSLRSSAIYGGRVLIKAKYIDINGGITIGPDTDWSVNLPASMMNPVRIGAFGNITGGGEIAIAD
ncbi:MAG: beta strand repeat-containing protein [Burkholderiales bacterium]